MSFPKTTFKLPFSRDKLPNQLFINGQVCSSSFSHKLLKLTWCV
jgi:aldehyde dehydrogenase (NAD+)